MVSRFHLALVALIAAAVICAIMAFLLAPPARAHVDHVSGADYGKLHHPITKAPCCNGHDCALLAPERVRAQLGGYVVDGKHFVPYAHALSSWDGKWHACFYPNPDTLRCLVAPVPGN